MFITVEADQLPSEWLLRYIGSNLAALILIQYVSDFQLHLLKQFIIDVVMWWALRVRYRLYWVGGGELGLRP